MTPYSLILLLSRSRAVAINIFLMHSVSNLHVAIITSFKLTSPVSVFSDPSEDLKSRSVWYKPEPNLRFYAEFSIRPMTERPGSNCRTDLQILRTIRSDRSIYTYNDNIILITYTGIFQQSFWILSIIGW